MLQLPNMGRIGTRAIFYDNGLEERVITTKIIQIPLGTIPFTIILAAPVLPDDYLRTGGDHLGMVRMDKGPGKHLLVILDLGSSCPCLSNANREGSLR